jgi:mRNA-degrading endonuclease toxin of MazEF toxin-antitoxin module
MTRGRMPGWLHRRGASDESRRFWQLDLGGRAGWRPALILTRQGVIAHVNKLTVAEITTQRKGYPTETALGQMGNLPKESFVQLDNIQTVSKTRFLKYLGTLDATTMRIVGRKLILALGLEDSL